MQTSYFRNPIQQIEQFRMDVFQLAQMFFQKKFQDFNKNKIHDTAFSFEAAAHIQSRNTKLHKIWAMNVWNTGYYLC